MPRAAVTLAPRLILSHTHLCSQGLSPAETPIFTPTRPELLLKTSNVDGVMCSLPLAPWYHHRWLSSCTAVCPRLLALPRYQLFRLFRDWAAGRVASGEAAGETSERVAYMFRGVGEIVWKEVGWSGIRMVGCVVPETYEAKTEIPKKRIFGVEIQEHFFTHRGVSTTSSRR